MREEEMVVVVVGVVEARSLVVCPVGLFDADRGSEATRGLEWTR